MNRHATLGWSTVVSRALVSSTLISSLVCRNLGLGALAALTAGGCLDSEAQRVRSTELEQDRQVPPAAADDPPTMNILVVDQMGLPLQDALVFASDAAGALQSEARSDAQGLVRFAGSDFASAHVAYERQVGSRVVRSLVSHYAPPDAGTLVLRTFRGGSSAKHTMQSPMTIHISADHLPVGTALMQFQIDCGSNKFVSDPNEEATFEGYTGCANSTSFGALAVAFSEDNVVLGAGRLTNIPFQPAGTVSLTVPIEAKRHEPFDVTLVGLNPSKHVAQLVVAGHAATLDWSYEVTAEQVSQLSLRNALPSGLFDRWTFEAHATSHDGSSGFQQVMFFPDDALRLPNVVDASVLAPLRIEELDTQDLAQLRLKYNLDGGARGDFVVGYASWGDAAQTNLWEFYADALDELRIVSPDLPESLAAWRATQNAVLNELQLFHVASEIHTNAAQVLAEPWYEHDYSATYALHAPQP